MAFRPPSVQRPNPTPLEVSGVPVTREQLAASLGMSYHTLRRRIKVWGIVVPSRQLLSPRLQREIRAALGFD